MNPIVLFSVCLVLTSLTACSGRPADQEPIGKYKVSKTNKDDGIYRPVKRNEGRYIHMVQPYVHIHDNRELGKYRHIPNPYDGGYGPYSGSQNPYEHDESGNYDKYTVSNADFDIPAIRLQYGFPDHDPEGVKKTCDLSGPQVYKNPVHLSDHSVPQVPQVPQVPRKPVHLSDHSIPQVPQVTQKPVHLSDLSPPEVTKTPVPHSDLSVPQVSETPVHDDVDRDETETATEKDIET